LLLLAGFLLATAALLTALTRLLFLLTGLLTTATLLAALTWILISHDLVSPAGKFLQRTTFIPQVRSSRRMPDRGLRSRPDRPIGMAILRAQCRMSHQREICSMLLRADICQRQFASSFQIETPLM
jgi:hypothetical protein